MEVLFSLVDSHQLVHWSDYEGVFSNLPLLHSTHCCRRVIQLNELSRKMETVQEQVLPFEGPQGINDDIVIKGSSQDPTHSGDAAAEMMMVQQEGGAAGAGGGGHAAAATSSTPHHKKGHHKGHNSSMPAPHQSSTWQHDSNTPIMPADRLTNFYRRYNKILLDNVAINKEKERLALENAQLQDLIQQYIQGTQLSDETLADDNPLFVVNGR